MAGGACNKVVHRDHLCARAESHDGECMCRWEREKMLELQTLEVVHRFLTSDDEPKGD